jgi:hypothetical protein
LCLASHSPQWRQLKENPEALAAMAEKVIAEGCFKTGECKQAAMALAKEFEANGYKATLVQLKTPAGEAIFKDGKLVAEELTEGHFGVQVGDLIFELNSTKGIPASQWAKGYEFRATGTTLIKNPTLQVVPPQ